MSTAYCVNASEFVVFAYIVVFPQMTFIMSGGLALS